MKVMLVTGGRDHTPTFAEAERFRDIVNRYDIDAMVHGDCPTGADAWAKVEAARLGLWVVGVPAPWDRFGPYAGPKRNEFVVRLALLLSGMWCAPVAFVFPGGRGTADAASRAKKAGFIMEGTDG